VCKKFLKNLIVRLEFPKTLGCVQKVLEKLNRKAGIHQKLRFMDKRLPKTYCEAGIHQKVPKKLRGVGKRLLKNLIVWLEFTKCFPQKVNGIHQKFPLVRQEFTKNFPITT
jgi:hypothetical protein